MKTNELTGAQLDYWVAKALGYKVNATENEVGYTRWVTPENHILCYPFEPSWNWSRGGPIIERERIGMIPLNTKITGDANGWVAVAYSAPDTDGYSDDEFNYRGPTPLIAAMRAFVASKYGDEVPDEAQA